MPNEYHGTNGFALALTTPIDAGSHLQQVQSADLELSLIGRQGTALNLDGLESAEFLGIGFNPTPNGANALTLAELRVIPCP